MAKAKFFYAQGTSYAVHWPEIVDRIYAAITPAMTAPPPGQVYQVAGLNGKMLPWDLSPPNDPFPDLLDTDIWEPIRVPYWSVMVPMGPSINSGISWLVNYMSDTAKMPAGTPFALGGYSQGAAVMSGILSELQTGSLTSRYSDLLGAVMFGNPRRMQDWRGPVGGTWSGSWDMPGSNSGGHGSFPTDGPWKRMTSNPPDTWVEFTAPEDIFSSTGDSPTGVLWTAGNDALLELVQDQLLLYLLGAVPIAINALAVMERGNAVNNFVDAAGTPFEFSGSGHTSYPFTPPADTNGNFPPSGDTCYQVALKYLNSLASQWAVTPIVVPDPVPVEAGWSPTLTPIPSPALSAGWSASL